MLESLTIRNYAIIDELAVSFSPGLNVITGETGAGKSIVVDAFELILGARASSEMIRSGMETLAVSAVFRIDAALLPDEVPALSDDGCLIIRREVRADGSGRCFINDMPVTVRILKALGDRLVDLHGQHAHQSLFDVTRHVEFLDKYGGFAELSETVAAGYRELAEIKRTIKNREERIERMSRDRDLHRFEREEIARADLKPDEDRTLDEELMRLTRAFELKSLGQEVFGALSESEDSLGERLDALSGKIGQLARYDGTLEPLLAKMDELSITVKDIAETFREYADGIDDDPTAAERVDERLALVERLKKKYGPSLGEVFEYFEKLGRESSDSEVLERELDDLRGHLAAVEKELFDRAHELSARRRKTAPGLAAEVEEHLARLGMPGARLVTDIGPLTGGERIAHGGKEVSVGPEGIDKVEFTFSANPGEQPKPLVKIASGGEISRVMLSLKLALIQVADVPTMVFDEIDIGVSGRIADAIGKMIRALAKKRQVLTITHLPQIAVMADTHFSARKRIAGGRTVTDLVLLDDKARQIELASLLSGDTLADTALAHAKELMERVGGTSKAAPVLSEKAPRTKKR